MIWSSFLHIYQPPWQTKEMTKKIAKQSYWRIVHILEKHPQAKITLNINGTLTEQLAANGEMPLLRALGTLAKRGQIEFVGSAKYHAILPLIPPKEVIRQIELNNLANRKYFGKWYKPKGFFPPEMCWDNKLASVLKKFEFEWVILDEIAVNPAFKKTNNITTACYDGVSNLHFFFRSRFASDLFTTAIVKSADHFLSLIGKRRADDMLITSFHAANLRPHSPPGHSRCPPGLVAGERLIKQCLRCIVFFIFFPADKTERYVRNFPLYFLKSVPRVLPQRIRGAALEVLRTRRPR